MRAQVSISVFYDYNADGAAPLVIEAGSRFGAHRSAGHPMFSTIREHILLPGELANIECACEINGQVGNIPANVIDRPLLPDWLEDLWHQGRVLVGQSMPATGGADEPLGMTPNQMRTLFSSTPSALPTTYTSTDYSSFDMATGSDFATTINWRLSVDQNGNQIQQVLGRQCVIDESAGYEPRNQERPRRPAREEPNLAEVWAD
jgi:hypothetical protein